MFHIYVPVDGSTKSAVTAVVFVALSGKMLPTAIVKQGKTPRCLKSKFNYNGDSALRVCM